MLFLYSFLLLTDFFSKQTFTGQSIARISAHTLAEDCRPTHQAIEDLLAENDVLLHAIKKNIEDGELENNINLMHRFRANIFEILILYVSSIYDIVYSHLFFLINEFLSFGSTAVKKLRCRLHT